MYSQKGWHQHDFNGFVAPPTWEEIMAQEKVTENHETTTPSKKKLFQQFSLSRGGNRATENFALQETQPSGTSRREDEALDQNDEDTNLEEGRFRKIINNLKSIPATSTVLSDLILLACALAVLVYGCLIQASINNPIKSGGSMDLVRILLPYKSQFRVLGRTFIASSAIHMVLVVPFGIVGVLWRKRRLLKYHNFFLLMYLLLEGTIFYFMVVRHLYVTADAKTIRKFSEDIYNHLTDCDIAENVNSVNSKAKGYICCCNRVPKAADNLCWDYYTELKEPNSDLNQYSRREYMQARKYYSRDCILNMDLFNRLKAVRRKALYYVPIFMIIQLAALCFGFYQKRIIQSQDPISEKNLRKKYRLPPKNQLEMVWRKTTEICRKILLLCGFVFLVLLGFVLVRHWLSYFTITVGQMEIPIFDFVVYLLYNPDNSIR